MKWRIFVNFQLVHPCPLLFWPSAIFLSVHASLPTLQALLPRGKSAEGTDLKAFCFKGEVTIMKIINSPFCRGILYFLVPF